MISSGKYRRVGQFKGMLFILGLILISAVFLYAQVLVDELRSEARTSLSMNLEHYRFLLEYATPFQAFEEIRRIDIPIILTGEDGVPKYWKNLGISQADTSASASRKLESFIREMDKVSPPIPIEYSAGYKDIFHYGDSNLITQLHYLPYISIALIGLFIFIGYMGFKNIKDNEQRSVWVGMARETAHQLGTPLSSLLGWMELLKTGDYPPDLYPEMEKDVMRLEKITARFSQIGSETALETAEIVPIARESVEYYRRRIPHSGKKIVITEDYRQSPSTKVNKHLLGWVLENLIRNSLDSITNEQGKITITLDVDDDKIHLDITDNGCGIDPQNRRNVFRPGYTTKKRGWGVGLSLAKRIVQDYHGGKLQLKDSHPGKGTTMRIILPEVK